MSLSKLSFNKGTPPDFYHTVKERVHQYFIDNKITEHANAQMVIKTIVLLAVYFGAYALVMSHSMPMWVNILLCVVLGIGTAGIGFSVAHDAIHGAYSTNKTVNYILVLTMNLIGGNKYVWSITHNIVHHTYTNIQDYDEDLDVSPALIRLSKNAKHQPAHRIQHFTFPFIYSLATIFWVLLKDYKKIFQAHIGPYQNKKHPTIEYIMLFGTKAMYYTYMLVLPVIIGGFAWWQVLIGFIIAHLVAGIILGIVFQLAHVVENIDFPLAPESGRVENTWAIHQMRTTSNFAMDNKIINWYVGGLNFQVEHHLFPRICHIHYPKISKIISATANEFNVPYNAQPTMLSAIKSHIAVLRTFSEPDHIIDKKMTALN